MNWDRIAGSWREYRGKARQKWGDMTDDEFTRIGGRRDELVGHLQRRYGLSRDEANRQVADWERSI